DTMEASGVVIGVKVEADIGAVVLRDDRARVLFVDFELSLRGFDEVLGMDRVPGIRRSGDRAHGRNKGVIYPRLDLGPGTWDLGPGTWDLGPATEAPWM